MPQSYSGDLRERVIGAVEAGASRREAADEFEISVSSAIRWVQRWREERSSEPKPRGGSCSVLEKYADRILALLRVTGYERDGIPPRAACGRGACAEPPGRA